MSLLRKIVAGGDKARTSRFHTEDDVLLGFGTILHDLPRVAYQKLRARIVGRRPPIPWWPLSAIVIAEQILTPSTKVAEFGSGSSTIWLALHSKTVLSFEDNAQWAGTTQARLRDMRLTNAEVLHRTGEQYYDIPNSAGPFEFAVVDGSWRWKCVEALIPRMAPGGVIYLDNADSDKDMIHYSDSTQSRLAQQIMQEYANSTPNARLEKVSSFIHGELYAGSGWFLHMSPEC